MFTTSVNVLLKDTNHKRKTNLKRSTAEEPILFLKIKALEAYESEMRDWPHPRSIKAVEHLARWRGATVGVEAAEAFMLIREIR